MEKECEHGVGHSGVHSCDGCCMPEEKTLEEKNWKVDIRDAFYSFDDRMNMSARNRSYATQVLRNEVEDIIKREVRSALEAIKVDRKDYPCNISHCYNCKTDFYETNGFNAAVAEQNRKIEDIINKLGV